MGAATKSSEKKRAEVSQKIDWWNPNLVDVSEYGAPARMMVNHSINTGSTTYAGTFRGLLADEDEVDAREKFLNAIVEETGATIPFTSCPIFGRGTYETWMIWPEGSIIVKEGPDQKFDVRLITINEQTYSEITKLFGDFILPEYVRQPIYSLAKAGNGSIEVGEVGVAGIPFEKENYDQETVAAFDFTVDELQRSEPLGRLTIISGHPGTGKTFFVRGLLNEVLDAVFVLIPPNMVEQLSGPELVPMLIRARNLIGAEKPLVLVIEDADKALVPRQNGDLGAISSLLNVSDGILGRALNVRIVCTTNAKLTEIDAALLRPGRLSKHIEIGLTPLDKAAEIFNRITDGQLEVNFGAEHADGIPLAQIYEFAKAAEIDDELSGDTEDDESEDDDEEDEDYEDDDEDDDDD